MSSKSTVNNVLYEYALDNLNVGIHVLNNEGKTLYYNKFAEKIDGIAKMNIMNKTMHHMINEGIFSDSVGLKVIETGKELQKTQKVNNKIVMAKGVPVYENQLLRYVVIYINDIQNLKDLEHQLDVLKEQNKNFKRYLSKYNKEFLNEDNIISRSEKMNKTIELIERVAKFDSTVLLTGESGVGKTRLAKYIHEKSTRKNEPFIKVDCSVISESLIESELFGYEEGSFTDAKKGGKDGLVTKAHNGTLFLDEIGDMPIKSQVKLLTLLQDQEIQPVGSTETLKLNIRVIAATNQNLEKLVKDGKFREDLYYRLKVVPIKIPPLRERKADITRFINLFLNKYNEYYSRDVLISPEGLRVLLSYTWPGNVREIENVIERLVVTSGERVVDHHSVKSSLPSQIHTEFSNMKSFKEKVIDYEKSLILYYAEKATSIKEIAELAGINDSTLRKKIERYNLKV